MVQIDNPVGVRTNLFAVIVQPLVEHEQPGRGVDAEHAVPVRLPPVDGVGHAGVSPGVGVVGGHAENAAAGREVLGDGGEVSLLPKQRRVVVQVLRKIINNSNSFKQSQWIIISVNVEFRAQISS